MAQLNALAASKRIESRYTDYLRATFSPERLEWRQEFEHALDDFALTTGPFLQSSPPFEHGKSIKDLIGEGVLSPGFERLNQAALPVNRPLYLHQEQSARKSINGKRNLVITTGTGSGKTECFLIPILQGLFDEIDRGTIHTPGVRALLLYPMNALANDQVKRLRQLLVDVPEITFGRYVGETRRKQSDAEDNMRARYPGEPRLPNELISREQMQESPPHILLTNYAMLEYLLLRPSDAPLFDGATAESWRQLVIDEAHVYGGAQGAEVAMLLRRVRDRVLNSRHGQLQCFATSATLGRGVEDYPQLVAFGEALFDERFEWNPDESSRQDVVAATRRPLVRATAAYELPELLYGELAEGRQAGESTAQLADRVRAIAPDVPVPPTDVSTPHFLNELLSQDRRTILLQQRVGDRAASVRELAADLFTHAGVEALVQQVGLAVTARADAEDSPLLPGRYHFFLRSLEGAFVCLHPNHQSGEPRLLLRRHEKCPSCARRDIASQMAELGTCRRCGSEYVVGRLELKNNCDVLVQPGQFDAGMRYFLLGEPLDVDDEDESLADVDDAMDPADRWLCPGCGVVGETANAPCACEKDRPPARKVTAAIPAGGGSVLHRCLSCASRMTGEIVFRFLTGTDAPVSVIATELYQSIPPSSDTSQAHLTGEGRKLLTFSDSRQDAAFFAPYLERTYLRSVQRRLIADAVTAAGGDARTDDLIVPIREAALDALVLDPDDSPMKLRSEISTWLMLETLGFDRRNSLEGTGLAEIAIAIPRRYEPPAALLRLGFTQAEVLDLIQMLLRTLRDSGALTVPPGVDIRDEVFEPRNREISVRAAGSGAGIVAWNPAVGSFNKRVDLLIKIFQRKGIDAAPRDVLARMWEHLTTDSQWAKILVSQSTKQGVVWKLSHEHLQFIPLSGGHTPWRCARCRQITWRTVEAVCPTFRCDGTVESTDDVDALMDQHYAKLYRTIEPIGMGVQEHTAHWTPAKAAEIQSDFTNGKLNVLSCSTTFELGVDVGEVQAVLLRNMPPSPANYVQRAGRAGRRTDSAALVVTYAQRRSHDLTFFEAPGRMIDGRIDPPIIVLDNATIGRRHAHSIAFAAFERATTEHRQVDSFFVDDTGGGSGRSACADFVAWLRTHPPELAEALHRVLPEPTAQQIGVSDWRWVNALVKSNPDDPTHGWLDRAEAEILDDVQTIADLETQASADGRHSLAGYYQRVGRTLRRRSLLGYLASRNVLPKYGFPVDVVELNLARTGDADAPNLELSRDLRIAISEYAPGSTVVAGKHLWASQGVAVRADRALPNYRWRVCRSCKHFRFALGDLPAECPMCAETASDHSGTFIIPIFGFAGAKVDRRPGEARPPRSGAVETHFGSYKDSTPKFVDVAGLEGVRYRTSRSGRVTVINRGPMGRGFRICEWCGHGEPAPANRKTGKQDAKHPDARRPDRQCAGTLHFRQLGHEYLTDTVEIDLSQPLGDDEARSVLYALLQGAVSLNVQRSDIDGTISWRGPNQPPTVVLLDAVPGGAGHALRLGERLTDLFEAALSRVESCECGEETSCYSCLRDYSNQTYHDRLSRGAAIRILRAVLGRRAASARLFDEEVLSDLELLQPEARHLVEAVIANGGPPPVVGWEVQGEAGDLPWIVEAAWPNAKVALLVDEVPGRDAALRHDGWELVAPSTDASALLELLNR